MQMTIIAAAAMPWSVPPHFLKRSAAPFRFRKPNGPAVVVLALMPLQRDLQRSPKNHFFQSPKIQLKEVSLTSSNTQNKVSLFIAIS
jgi:hypothetical protein